MGKFKLQEAISMFSVQTRVFSPIEFNLVEVYGHMLIGYKMAPPDDYGLGHAHCELANCSWTMQARSLICVLWDYICTYTGSLRHCDTGSRKVSCPNTSS